MSVQSTFGEPEWSEPIIVLGKGVERWSRRYKKVNYCISGIGENSGWLRLYPIFSTDIKTFNVIRVAIRHKHPEKLRPESRKVCVEPKPKKVGHIGDEITRTEILKRHLDSGHFLHDNSWRGIKSLGLLQPIYPGFEVDRREKKVWVRYFCNTPGCRRHKNEVMDVYAVNRVGRRYIRTPLDEIEKKLLFTQREFLLGRNQLWFVMGTHAQHPSKWLLIEMHITMREGGTERLTKWLDLSKGPR